MCFSAQNWFPGVVVAVTPLNLKPAVKISHWIVVENKKLESWRGETQGWWLWAPDAHWVLMYVVYLEARSFLYIPIMRSMTIKALYYYYYHHCCTGITNFNSMLIIATVTACFLLKIISKIKCPYLSQHHTLLSERAMCFKAQLG